MCLACKHASDDTKDALIRRQAVTIDRLRGSVDTFKLAAANARIRELEETLSRVNRSNPRGMATEVVRDLAQMDPRCNDDTMACFFCCQKGSHRRDCMWHQASIAAQVLERDDKRRRTA